MSSSKAAYYAGAKPRILEPLIGSIPAMLKSRPQWICWELVKKKEQWAKVPIIPSTGKPAKTNDSRTWATFESSLDYYREHQASGIGYVFSALDPLVGVDIDDVRDRRTGRLDERAERLIARAATYAEVSPSGTGVKLFGLGQLPEGCRHRIGKVEVYGQGRYFAVTGCVLSGPDEPRPFQTTIDYLLGRMEPAKPTPLRRSSGLPTGDRRRIMDRVKAYLAKVAPAVSGCNGHGKTFGVVMALVQGFALSDDEFWAAIVDWNARCEPPWSQKALDHKLRSARERIDSARLGEMTR